MNSFKNISSMILLASFVAVSVISSSEASDGISSAQQQWENNYCISNLSKNEFDAIKNGLMYLRQKINVLLMVIDECINDIGPDGWGLKLIGQEDLPGLKNLFEIYRGCMLALCRKIDANDMDDITIDDLNKLAFIVNKLYGCIFRNIRGDYDSNIRRGGIECEELSVLFSRIYEFANNAAACLRRNNANRAMEYVRRVVQDIQSNSESDNDGDRQSESDMRDKEASLRRDFEKRQGPDQINDFVKMIDRGNFHKNNSREWGTD